MLKLNDFHDLLYEKENTITQQGLNPPEYFEREKYYTMGPGIDFPMIMSYKDTENPAFEPYFYFLNGHNDVVYFADSNFTENQIESYEYNPWGVLLTDANKNNFLYTAREFDFDTDLQFNRMRYYNPNIGRYNMEMQSKLMNKFTFFNNNQINFYSSTGSGSTSDCMDDCFDEREENEYDCWDEYDACIRDCYDFEPPDIPVPEGVRIAGPIKGKNAFPEYNPPKDEGCNCDDELKNCLFFEVSNRFGNCIEGCYK